MMYTGNYYPKEDGMKLPKDYGGSAFGESVSEVAEPEQDTDSGKAVETGGGGLFESISSRLSLEKLVPEGLRSALHLDKFKIGTEELLIIALALFLFLSKDGDKECAIILFLLLFIN